MKTASKIFAAMAFAAFYESCASSREFNPGGVVFGLILLALSGICAAVADSETKRVKDEDARTRVEKVLKGEDAYFYLYLRPFSITKKIPMQNPKLKNVQDSFHPERIQDFERVLATALEKRGIPLLALGKPGEAVGAGRYLTDDENWQSIFEALASAATAIVMIPSSHSGTLTEIKWLIDHHMVSKTVFLHPLRKGDMEWDSVVRIYQELGLHLPDRTAAVIFKLGADGDPIATAPLTHLWTDLGGLLVQELALLGKESDTGERIRVEKALKPQQTYFYLYLRPFGITNDIPAKNPQLQYVQDSLPEGAQDFERLLAAALETSAIPMVVLGKPGEPINGDRHQTDGENWQSAFESLASDAAAIIVVPSLDAGTLAEVQWLAKRQMIGKTVFSHPPRKDDLEWNSVVTTYKEFGLHLPKSAYSSVFKLADDGKPIATVPLQRLRAEGGGKVVQELASLKTYEANPNGVAS